MPIFVKIITHMKKLVIAVLTVLAAAGCAKDTAKYVISGTGLEDGAVVRLVDQISMEAIDTAVVADGTFALKGKAGKDAFLALSADGSNWTFPLINDGEALEFDFEDHAVDGSDLNEKIAECDRKTDALLVEYNTFFNELVKLPEEEQMAKMPEHDVWYKKLSDCLLGVIEENMDNLVPVAFIRNLLSLSGPDKFNELLASNAPFTQHPYVLDLKRRIDESEARQKEADEKKQAIIGQKFLDLEEADPDGNQHKLSEYAGQGKWVLVDFWASWCGPCKAEMPNVVNAYKKYHDKGFEVVGLSFDREKEPWVEAITSWEMPWIHLSDLKYWQTVATEVYNVNSIPDNLLIDPEGTVVARCLRGDALEAKLAEIFK